MKHRKTIKLICSLTFAITALMHCALTNAAIVTMESTLFSQNGYKTDFRFSYDNSTSPIILDQNSSALKSFSWSVYSGVNLLHSQSIVTNGIFTSTDGAWSFRYDTTSGIESLLTGEYLPGHYLFSTTRAVYGKIPYQNARSLVVLGNAIVSSSVYQPAFRVATQIDLPPVASVPEPSIYGMIGLGLLGIAGVARRRQQQVSQP